MTSTKDKNTLHMSFDKKYRGNLLLRREGIFASMVSSEVELVGDGKSNIACNSCSSCESIIDLTAFVTEVIKLYKCR